MENKMEAVLSVVAAEGMETVILDLMESQERNNILFNMLKDRGLLTEKDFTIVHLKSVIARAERLLRIRSEKGLDVSELVNKVVDMKAKLTEVQESAV